jgi:hypothetical protein
MESSIEDFVTPESDNPKIGLKLPQLHMQASGPALLAACHSGGSIKDSRHESEKSAGWRNARRLIRRAVLEKQAPKQRFADWPMVGIFGFKG